MASANAFADPGMMLIDDPVKEPVAAPKPVGPVSDIGNGTLSAQLHPLVIINISEHFTRIKAQHGSIASPVCGAILGTQDGRRVEIFNSFELVINDANGAAVIDSEFLESKSQQFKEVFPTLDILGWYTTGSAPNALHLALHKQMMTVNESPLFLLLDPAPSAAARELPLMLFESAIEINNGEQIMNFVSTGYTLATEEAERIGVDHVAKVSGTNGQTTSSEVTVHLTSHRSAMAIMLERINIISSYLTAVKEGKVTRNHQILREIAGLASKLPIDSSGNTGSNFAKSTNDALLISHMAMMTKGLNAMSEMIEKLPLNDRGVRRVRQYF